jgi:fluoride exporter
MGFLIVFLGAGLGGAARHGVNMAALRLLGPGAFPYGTLAINVLGSFLIGAVAEVYALRSGLPPAWRLFLTTGILGGFTTFSAFSLETVALYERGAVTAALAYVGASVVLAVGALAAALALVRALLSGG